MPKMYTTPVFPILYCLALTQADITAIRSEYDIPEAALQKSDRQGNASFVYSEDNHIIVVQIDDSNLDDKLTVLSLIVHEATHVKQFLCEHIGEHSPSAEFEAYTVQQITHNLFVEYEANGTKFAKEPTSTPEIVFEIDHEALNGIEI